LHFGDFERRAHEDWDRIPAEYKDGIDGLVVERGARAHPSLPDVYTLGECVTESWPSDFESPDSVRSLVVLYYGSFRRLAALDPDFDWEEELWETLTHELQHHLESLARDEGLLDLDYAMDETFKRREGEPFDPAYYRSGEARGEGWYAVEDELYLEIHVDDGEHAVILELDGTPYRIDVPAGEYDIAFLEVTAGLPPTAPPLTVVLVRRRRFPDLLRALFRRRPPRLLQTEAHAKPEAP
jgi:hypothetical protein